MPRKVDLAALASTDVPASTPSRGSPGVTELPLDKVSTNPLNKRTDADEDQAELNAMAETIKSTGSCSRSSSSPRPRSPPPNRMRPRQSAMRGG